ncbi:CHAD domain-containing protein [Methanoregula sp.]|uniref:CHAD domain-containing protein n=1 Tax=Methanoregula sp. TaxID=2052170 RepID=UPI002C74C610|nr:CHAD domain-containing protein [Methanoregula sp.]HVP95882.1 CHAD domain-containing protein [Methanoregula sp.]
MQAPEPAPAIPGPCIFGMGRLLPLIDVLTAEVAGVRADDDIEHVHRMRVASRRLRAALPLFAECFPEKEYRAWLREIKKITRALGAARDTDVQIAFLKKFLKAQAGPQGADRLPGGEPRSGDPLALHLHQLQKQRGTLQKQVVAVLDELERSQALVSLRAACSLPPEPAGRRKRKRFAGILPVAAQRMGRRLAAIHQYEPFVHNPDAIFEHHALRIAAKKLRYTLEAYAPLYRRDLAKPLARIKRLQDILGDIHDCDVWIEEMSVAIVKQRARRHPQAAGSGPSVSAVAPLRRLLFNREKRRTRLYRQFVRYWDALARNGFWDELAVTALSGQRSGFCHTRMLPAEKERGAFIRLAATVPGHEAHTSAVTALALRLFDELVPLHGLSRRDRTLLSFAAIVHDIGWIQGQTGHQQESSAMILAAPALPVPVREQGIVALVAGLHGGKVARRPDGFFTLLTPPDKKRVRSLAALLRIADGLDYLHAGNVTGLSCTIRANNVLCTLTGSGDLSVEKARAIRKSDLFAEVFEKPLVIA